jgi:signal transduction histidine kinase/DNA-binding response OmpR family regulator
MLHILHLEDSKMDAVLIARALAARGIKASISVATSSEEFVTALDQNDFDLILADNAVPGLHGAEALKLVEQKSPGTPVICVSGAATEEMAFATLQAGATNYVLKDQLWQLVAAIRSEQERLTLAKRNRAMARLVSAIEELSLARDLNAVTAIVRKAARELTDADGATFVLRQGECCYYADEEAIAPLWKGQRFPLQACISGWVMLNHQAAVIEDIYTDVRIPADAYRATFVKSLAMVPIRTAAPIGAIGNYWASQRMPAPEEVELLQALANTTAVALENVQVYAELEQRVKERTLQLELANRELETYSYAVSHDLGAPVRRVRGFSDLLLDEKAQSLDQEAREWLGNIRAGANQMGNLINDLLRISKLSKAALNLVKVNLTELVAVVLSRFAADFPERTVEIRVAAGMEARGDQGLLQAALENLLSNAWKYTSKQPKALIEFGSNLQADGSIAFFVRDNGTGFDMAHAQKLFRPFQRIHNQAELFGNGVGLATVQRIVERHGGRIWAEAVVGQGATFYFTLGTNV